MRSILIILLLLGELNTLFAVDPFRKRPEKRNIDHFNMAAYPLPVADSDSIKVIAYLEIPYLALQFLKHDSTYRADFQGTITLRDKEGYQYGRKIWKDSVVVDNYISTVSLSLSTITWTSFTVPPGKYHLVAQLMDMDTKNTGENTGDWDLTVFSGPDAVFPPIVLENKPGDWGFGEGLIPVINREIRNLEDSLKVVVYFKTDGEATLRLNLVKGDNHRLWNRSQIVNEATSGQSMDFYLDPSLFDGILFKIKAELESEGKSYTQSVEIKVDKPGISSLVTDVNDALDQMMYILNSKERHKLKSASEQEREALFKEFWKVRDPNPETEQNELMDEYYRRIKYSNEHFTGFTAGWMTDMGMIYVLFGPPDEVERSTSTQSHRSYELWYYHRINRQFLFIDYNGFGDFRLDVPLVGDPFRGL